MSLIIDIIIMEDKSSMYKFKMWLKKEKVKTMLLAGIFALILTFINLTPNIYRTLSDFFCMLGLMLILIGSTRYIRNVGLFKTFPYLAYKLRWKSNSRYSGELRVMSLAEYTQTVVMDETRHLPVAWVMCAGLLCGTMALILAFLVG